MDWIKHRHAQWKYIWVRKKVQISISVSKYALRGNWGSEEGPFVLHRALKTVLKLLEPTMQKASTTGKCRKVEPGDKQTGTWWKEQTWLSWWGLYRYYSAPFSGGVHGKLDGQYRLATKPTLVKAKHEWENKTKCQSVQVRFPEIILTYYIYLLSLKFWKFWRFLNALKVCV